MYPLSSNPVIPFRDPVLAASLSHGHYQRDSHPHCEERLYFSGTFYRWNHHASFLLVTQWLVCVSFTCDHSSPPLGCKLGPRIWSSLSLYLVQGWAHRKCLINADQKEEGLCPMEGSATVTGQKTFPGYLRNTNLRAMEGSRGVG